ncbi:amino acid ABC transporter ATP-binding protein [Loigolactobacillus backii]|uniref:amino acid ABC transporter ATP-binding protein n=1 Tax=Loigolactobacillus backii TaxID=375175 RepID=UPI000C1CB866|nr:amino acid ABC transporter ATP-binding protein [Loigolactobacillus backii]MDA5388950.1 amino acid ABC transporter ATP-binding protein [Loigolactobacillus backii]MDA5391457.1 amino acid ABC transporter ATP-binding protein [Loigolactobacillus backii]PIO82640.1 amino acid ABC transporter ATP-binding protein [Loigolactobacillus backii]
MIKVKNLTKQFQGNSVLKDISFEIKKNQTVALIGSSGGGKSTILRCLNLLERPTSGFFKIDNIEVNAEHIDKNVIQKVRSITGMVFQDYNLFQHLTVLENITLGLKTVKHVDTIDADHIARNELEHVGLVDKANMYPAQLSGGQQQRVAIARSLALKPRVLLMDEPTSALDPEMIGGILTLIHKIIEETDITILIVTHEMQFAYEVADKVIFLSDGEIAEQGTSAEIFSRPKKQVTKNFLKNFRKISDWQTV